jgi:hypothetical protein
MMVLSSDDDYSDICLLVLGHMLIPKGISNLFPKLPKTIHSSTIHWRNLTPLAIDMSIQMTSLCS